MSLGGACLTLTDRHTNHISSAMDTQPHSPDPTLLLPRDSYYQLIHTLRAALPPPVTNSPEDLARRDNAAIAQSLPPGLTRWSPRCSPPLPTRPALPLS